MTATIAILSENPAATWWEAARTTKPAPRELRPLLTGKATAIDVEPARARELRAWCAALPGWDSDRAPLAFGGLVGRPITAARNASGIKVNVRLAPDEALLIQALADARGETLAQVLRDCALVEAKRDAAAPAKRRSR
jgi:hypothetical protein